MNVQNRGSSGSGHGWSGTQIMFWNSNATRWRVHAANGAMSWAVGMIGEKGGFLPNRIPEPDGIHQSLGSFVTPRSLYYAQLKDRLGPNALRSVVLPNQKSGNVWDDLSAWMGEGLFGAAVVAWLDEDVVPVSTGSSLTVGGYVRDLNLLGNSPSFSWSMLAGPGSATFGDTTSLETTVSFGAPGSYSLQLLVTDGVVSESASLDVTVDGPAITPAPSTSPVPSSSPSKGPTPTPTKVPSNRPTTSPSSLPSLSPSRSPAPSSAPSISPSASPTVTTVCNNDGTCQVGESCDTCATDCPSGSIPGATCGNGICEIADGENCLNCSADCNGVQSGNPNNRYCCGNIFGGENPVSCADSRCGGPSQCTDIPAPTGSYCCGNGSCEIGEDEVTCAVDCAMPSPPITVTPSSPAPTPAPVLGCGALGDTCTVDSDCCGNKCRGATGNMTCK